MISFDEVESTNWEERSTSNNETPDPNTDPNTDKMGGALYLDSKLVSDPNTDKMGGVGTSDLDYELVSETSETASAFFLLKNYPLKLSVRKLKKYYLLI